MCVCDAHIFQYKDLNWTLPVVTIL